MKISDLFCTSRASTAVSDRRRRPVTGDGEGRLLHPQHHPHDHRIKGQLHHHVPCLSSQLPINPIPKLSHYHFQKHRKSSCSTSSSSTSTATMKTNPTHEHHDHINLRRKSAADVHDLKIPTPGSSARYLLADDGDDHHSNPFIDLFSLSSPERFPALVQADHPTKSRPLARSITVHECRRLNLKSPSFRTSSDQVVVLKVSLHCKGCEGKVKKHLSKMEGVTSFSVDFTTKKVTITGDVTPLAVLASVSKVKHAEFWPSPTSTSTSSSSSSSSSSSQGRASAMCY